MTTVQIVTWNSAGVIEACLASLARQTSRAFEVVVVDNASTDATLALVERWRDRVPALVVLPLDRNAGFCAGQNRALSASAAPWVLLLNPDTTLPPDFIERAANVVATVSPRVGSVAPCLVRADGALDSTGLAMDRFRRAYDRDHGRDADGAGGANRDVFGCTGAAALLRRRMLEDVAVNGEVLDEALFAYYDDLDLAWRATLRGWSCRYEPTLVAHHERGGRNAIVARDGRVTVTRDRQLGVRNRLLVIARCDRGGDVLRALPWLVPFEMARIAYLLLRAPKVLAAYVDVLRGLGSALRARGEIHRKGATASLPALPWRVR